MGAIPLSKYSGLRGESHHNSLLQQVGISSGNKTLLNLTMGEHLQSAQPFGSLTDTSSQSIINTSSKTSSTRDTFVVLLTLTVISITLYFSYYLWKKHRHRSLSAASKLEEYRYSRLSQNEIDVDNVQFSDPLSPLEDSLCEPECDDEDLKPAMLQLETDALITISDNHSSDQNPSSNLPTTNGHSKSGLLIDDISDEDLLQ